MADTPVLREIILLATKIQPTGPPVTTVFLDDLNAQVALKATIQVSFKGQFKPMIKFIGNEVEDWPIIEFDSDKDKQAELENSKAYYASCTLQTKDRVHRPELRTWDDATCTPPSKQEIKE